MDPRGKSEFLNALLLIVSKLKRKKIEKEKSTYQQILVLQSPSLVLKANVTLNLELKIPSTCYMKFIGICYRVTVLCSLANIAWHTFLKQVNTSLFLQKILSEMEIHFIIQVLPNSSEWRLSQKTSIWGSTRVLEGTCETLFQWY